MQDKILRALFAAAVAGGTLAACGGSDDAPTPAPAPPQTLPSQLPTSFTWFSPTSLAGTTQLLRTGASGTAEGQTYSFAADAAGRITVSGASVVATMSEIADQGAVLQLCREASTQGVVAVMVDAALAPLTAADLNGVTVDETICRATSGPWVRHTFSIAFTATTAIFYEGGVEQARVPLVDLMGAGSNLFQGELGTMRLKAFRRPGGQIVIVLTQSGGTDAPPNREPAAVFLGIQRP